MSFDKSTSHENKMGSMPVFKLIVNLSLPMMFSMLIQAFYNIVDSIFVSRLGESALTAVSLAFPIQNLMISFSVGTAIGVNALLSMRLGQKKQEDVNKAAMNGIFLAIITYAIFSIAGLFFLEPYMKTQVHDEEIIQYGIDYLQIVIFIGFGMFIGIMLDKLLQSTGKSIFAMLTQLIGAITNIIFDPLLIFGIGPFPELGIKGAAIATVLGQVLGMIASLVFNFKFNKDIQLNLKAFRPDIKIIGNIYKVGIPSIILNSITSLTTGLINRILGTFTSTAIAVYGVYFKLNSFIFMPVFGLNSGIVPILAYNYGAKYYKRITTTIKDTIIIALIIMGIGTIIFEFLSIPLLKLFDASKEMLKIGIPAMRIIASSFIGAAFAIVLSSVFQAFSSALLSMIVSISRQLLVLLPSAYLLSLTGNINYIWFCFPIAEVISVLLSLIFMKKVYVQKIKPLKS